MGPYGHIIHKTSRDLGKARAIYLFIFVRRRSGGRKEIMWDSDGLLL
jgi:hypothetical protein